MLFVVNDLIQEMLFSCTKELSKAPVNWKVLNELAKKNQKNFLLNHQVVPKTEYKLILYLILRKNLLRETLKTYQRSKNLRNKTKTIKMIKNVFHRKWRMQKQKGESWIGEGDRAKVSNRIVLGQLYKV